MSTRENSNSVLCSEFLRRAKEVLAHFPDVKHEWSVDKERGQYTLRLPKESDDGFDIAIEVSNPEITVCAGETHVHVSDMGASPEETVDKALGLVRDLLSPDMRLVEKWSNGRPYKWSLQVLRNGTWHTEAVTGELLFNPFGRRSEKIFSNYILSARSSTSET